MREEIFLGGVMRKVGLRIRGPLTRAVAYAPSITEPDTTAAI